jgi:hypothetical protein
MAEVKKPGIKRLKEPLDPALDAPVALTPDELDKVVGGIVESQTDPTTTGAEPPPRP